MAEFVSTQIQIRAVSEETGPMGPFGRAETMKAEVKYVKCAKPTSLREMGSCSGLDEGWV